MSKNIREGSPVKWSWGDGQAEGKVIKTWAETHTETIDGNEVTRHGEPNNKALLIETDKGDKVLKLEQEVNAN